MSSAWHNANLHKPSFLLSLLLSISSSPWPWPSSPSPQAKTCEQALERALGAHRILYPFYI